MNWQMHLNKLRWVVLSVVMSMLILLPFLHLYQSYEAAHAYDLLKPGEKLIYDTMEILSSPFISDPENDLNSFKGTTWSGKLFGVSLSDPLSLVGQITAGKTVYWPFVLTVLIPILLTLLLGRFYCGWICPATFLYELNDNLGTWLRRAGLPISRRRLDRRIKYLVLLTGMVIGMISSAVVFAAIYPPAIIGREIYYAIAVGGFGSGMVFFLLTLLFDLLVARRGFCRYICPGGALYSLLGRFRPMRIQREVQSCNDCAKCNTVCQFALDPWHDDFGQECNNCSACIAICPTEALSFKIQINDCASQGPGHLGQEYKKQQGETKPASGEP